MCIAPDQTLCLSPFLCLSALEQRVLRGFLKEVPARMLATELGITEAALYQHVKSLCRKLRVARRTEAIKVADLKGL